MTERFNSYHSRGLLLAAPLFLFALVRGIQATNSCVGEGRRERKEAREGSFVIAHVLNSFGFLRSAALTCGTVATLLPSVASAQVRISQIYVGGGMSASPQLPMSTFTHDYVELFCDSAEDVSLQGWTLFHANASSTSWQSFIVLPAGARIRPGGYYLVRCNSITVVASTFALPTPDHAGSSTILGGGIDGINFSSGTLASSGSKLVLMRPGSGQALSAVSGVTNPTTDARFASFVSDFVGIGGANAAEGSAARQPGVPAQTFVTTSALVRREAGCVDTDNNFADFEVLPLGGDVWPRNSNSQQNTCGRFRCGAIDFNNDGLFPDDQDLVDFLSVLAGGACSTEPQFGCGSIDFNNDELFPDDQDLVDFLIVLAGGQPTTCE